MSKPVLAVDVTHLPFEYLGTGWGLAHRPDPKGPIYIGPGPGKLEAWAIQPRAELQFTTPDGPRGEAFHLTLNLRSPFHTTGEVQAVRFLIGDQELGRVQVGMETAETKLVILPVHLIEPGASVTLVLEAESMFPIGSECVGDEEGQSSIELSSLRLFRGVEEFLESVSSEYERVRVLRDELFDRGIRLLEDRGELLDKVVVTSEHLDRLDIDTTFARDALESIVKDPFVVGGCESRPIFDESYYHERFDDLVEGRINSWIRAWERGMDSFHRAVVQLGNRAFLTLGDQKPSDVGVPEAFRLVFESEEELPREELLLLKERNDYLNTLELLLRRDRLESVVPDLEIEMSSYCNYACVMCGRSWKTFQFKRQTDVQLLRILPALPYLRHVTIAGVGENTSSNRLGLFARLCERFCVQTRIFTNGSMIHRQLDTLARFDKVCVSFDGGTAETFEGQRRGANFAKVLENVRMLRERAPDRELAFSVVVSRLNRDEIPQIVELAARLGVDHVALSPVWHDSPLQLRASDREVFADRLAEARRIAEPAGVVIQVNVGAEDFEVVEDAPHDRKGILDWLEHLEFPSNRTDDWETLRASFDGLRFPYHPDPRVFRDRRHPEPPSTVRRRTVEEDRAASFEFDVSVMLQRTERLISAAEAELAALDPNAVEMPYCLSIWKYTYTRANGKNRLCPQAFTDVGNVGLDGFQGVTNSEKNRHYRRTMFGGELEDSCRKCLDPYRRWRHAEVVEQVKGLGLRPLDRTRYACRHEDEFGESTTASPSSGADLG
ncbi:MAG: radical SAM protein [Planctomycetes bacterium]|nr:radical SAM protein [Planctomycetota bacterium]